LENSPIKKTKENHQKKAKYKKNNLFFKIEKISLTKGRTIKGEKPEKN